MVQTGRVDVVTEVFFECCLEVRVACLMAIKKTTMSPNTLDLYL
jgi:hypothetical protein